ncbi:MAG: hypothetical protein M5U34_47355 [Chloroflexi bacterium]|nr:hypothetical protein [Chloroflexota bacterium]
MPLWNLAWGDGAVVVETAVAVMISVGNVDTVVTCVLVVLTVAVFNAISAVLVTKAGGGVDFKEAVCKADVVTVGLFCGLIGAAFSDATEVGTGTVATYGNNHVSNRIRSGVC